MFDTASDETQNFYYVNSPSFRLIISKLWSPILYSTDHPLWRRGLCPPPGNSDHFW